MGSQLVDWEAIHRRLAIATAAVSGTAGVGEGDARRILEARARTLAKTAAKPEEGEQLEILGFSLAAENYGVETRYVREVCQLKDLTPLPCSPVFVAGVMNLRGRILAVVDLRKFFELPAKGLTELNRVIVLKKNDKEFGLLADTIAGVSAVSVASLQEGLPTLTGIRERFLKGVTGRMLAILDGDRLLGDARLTVNEQVAK